ncbi:MAG: DUF1015 domain-containing protein [Anaerolineales bacterium]
MVQIRPFRGLRYAVESDPALYAPPYDVIDPHQRQALLAASPYNVAAIDVGPTPPDSAWYDQAAHTLRNWLARGVLRRDDEPALYGYRQTFQWAGQHYTRCGVMACVRLAPWGQGIHRHELTRSQPKADRLQLMRALNLQASPVFGLFEDPQRLATAILNGSRPADALDITDGDGVRHVFWPITTPNSIATLQRVLAGSDVVIADGHHRYETALALSEERRASQGSSAADDVLMCLVPVDDPGLLILPTHRVIKTAALAPDALLSALAQRLSVTPTQDALSAAIAGRKRAFGLRLPGQSYVLSLPDTGPAGQDADALDVSLLRDVILEPVLGITAEQLADSDLVSYTIDESEACRRVDDGQAALALILNPTPLSAVWSMALRGQVMPQKSTFFYPKLLTGLVMNPLWD